MNVLSCLSCCYKLRAEKPTGSNPRSSFFLIDLIFGNKSGEIRSLVTTWPSSFLFFFLTLAYCCTHKRAMIEHVVLKCSALVPRKILQEIKMYIAGEELGSIWKGFLERTTDTPFSSCHLFAWNECQSTLNLHRRKHTSKHQISFYSLLLCLHSHPQMNFEFTTKMLYDDALVLTFPKIPVLALAMFFLMTNIAMPSCFSAQCQQIFLC